MVKKLTKSEQEWCSRLGALIDEMPKSLVVVQQEGSLKICHQDALEDDEIDLSFVEDGFWLLEIYSPGIVGA